MIEISTAPSTNSAMQPTVRVAAAASPHSTRSSARHSVGKRKATSLLSSEGDGGGHLGATAQPTPSMDLFASLIDVGQQLWKFYGNDAEKIFLDQPWRTSVLGTIVGLICAQNTTNQWSSVMYGNIVALCPRVTACPTSNHSIEAGCQCDRKAAPTRVTPGEPPEPEADWDRLRLLCAAQLRQGVGLRSLEISLANGPVRYLFISIVLYK